MTPFKAYSEFMALRAHFSTTKYDYFKYHGALKWVTPASYQKRKDQYFFERLAKRKDYKDFLVANLVQKPGIWIVALNKPEAEEVYTKWKLTMQSLGYLFRSELRRLPEQYDLFQLLKCGAGVTPLLLQHYLSNDISLETFCILIDLTGIKKFWDKKVTVPEWTDVSVTVEKYTPFISYEKDKMKQIVYAKFHDASLFVDYVTDWQGGLPERD